MPTAQDLPMTEASANLPVKGWWFPLQSKKARDFAIWKEIIKFIDVELSGTKGWIRRFPEKLKQLEAMCQALSATRQFQPMDGIR